MQNIDNEYLSKLQDHYQEHRLVPSIAGIGNLVGMTKRGAAKLAQRLIEAGYLQKGEGGKLAPTGMFFGRTLVGSAPAGFASPAYEILQDAITIDEYLVEHPSSTVLVEVQGESMINAGINDNDILVVERNARPAIGKIVVAIIDGEFTVKHLRRDKEGYFLEPANEQFPIIRPQGSLEIFGEVVGQFRKMR